MLRATRAVGGMSDVTVRCHLGKWTSQYPLGQSLIYSKSAKCRKKGVQCLGYTKPLRYVSLASKTRTSRHTVSSTAGDASFYF